MVWSAQAQSNIYADSSLAEILSLKWERKYEKNDFSIYNKKPLIINNIVVGHFNTPFVIDLRSGLALEFSDPRTQNIIKSNTSDSLVYYHLMDKVVIKNIYNGKNVFVRGKQKGYQIEWKMPLLISSDTVHFKEKDNYLTAYNYRNNNKVWQVEFPERIHAFDYYKEDKINLTTQTTFYQIAKLTGKILWSLPIVQDGKSTLNTELNLYDDKLYLWAESAGLNVVNLETRKIESTWMANHNNADFTMQMVFTGGYIFARTPLNIYCISIEDGSVLWQSEDIDIRSDLILCNDYIFFYQRGQENDVDVLTAFNIKKHKVEYAQFTSEKYPPKNINEGIYKNPLDLTVISFARGLHQGKYLIGSDITTVYCFELLGSAGSK